MSTEVQAIYPAMGEVMKNLGAIGKNKNVTMNGKKGYAYRSIEDITLNINPLLAEYGIFLLPEVLEHREETHRVVKEGTDRSGKTYKNERIDTHAVVKMRYHFVATADGSSVSAEGVGESMDSSDKAYGKATTYALKNVLADVFVIPIDDPKRDPDHENRPREVAKPRANPLDIYKTKLLEGLKAKDIMLTTIEDKVGKTLNAFTMDDYKKASGIIKKIELYKQIVTICGTQGITIQQLEESSGSKSTDWTVESMQELVDQLKTNKGE